MDPAAGRGRGADRPRAGLLAGASPGAVGARGLRRHYGRVPGVGNRVATGEAYSVPEP